MVHIPEQEEITENPTGSIDTAATADTVKPPDNALKSYGRKGAKRKYKTRRADPIKLEIPKFTGRCTGLSGFIYDLGPNKTDKYIKKIEIEEYAGKPMGRRSEKQSIILRKSERFCQSRRPYYGSTVVINAH